MSDFRINSTRKQEEEWLKVLGKGMVTLPKRWRDELGIEEGAIVKAIKEGDSVIIQPVLTQEVPYRVYTDAEIEEFLKEDVIPDSLRERVKKKLSNSSNT